jgi:hypothetical protein
MISLNRIELSDVPWNVLDSFGDRNLFQTKGWLKFIERTQQAEPVVAELRRDGRHLGYFTGLIVSKWGFRVLGSPFQGWNTEYMGFNLLPGISREKVLEPLFNFAFRKLGCHHIEMIDPHWKNGCPRSMHCEVRSSSSFEIDLTRSEEELFGNMKPSCRRAIRKAGKSGVRIEEATDDAFGHDYYAQLIDVFAKQSLVPPYGIERVNELIRQLQPTGQLLLLRARDPKGLCIATGIFPSFNSTMYFWGGASWRQYQKLRPNEPLTWHAMRHWKNRGVKKFNLGGGGDYKKKYGTHDIVVFRLIISRYPLLIPLRHAAERSWRFRQAMLGRMRAVGQRMARTRAHSHGWLQREEPATALATGQAWPQDTQG